MKKFAFVAIAIFIITQAFADDLPTNTQTTPITDIDLSQTKSIEIALTAYTNTDTTIQAHQKAKYTEESLEHTQGLDNSVRENSIVDDSEQAMQSPEQKAKLQKLFNMVSFHRNVDEKHLTETFKQLTEILNAIDILKKQGFSIQQIETLITNLVPASEQKTVVAIPSERLLKRVFFHPTTIASLISFATGAALVALMMRQRRDLTDTQK